MLLLRNKEGGIGDVAHYQQGSFYTGNGTPFEEPAHQPEEDGRTDEHQHIHIVDASHRKRRDGSTASQYKEYIEQVAADHITDGNTRILFSRQLLPKWPVRGAKYHLLQWSDRWLIRLHRVPKRFRWHHPQRIVRRIPVQPDLPR